MRSFFLALCLLALPAAAQAEERTAIPVTAADLASEDSLAALYERIEFEAEKLCGEGRFASSPLFRHAGRCSRDAVDRAIRGAGIAPLAAYHEARAPQQAPAQSATLAAR